MSNWSDQDQRIDDLEVALADLIKYCASGKRYEQINPYFVSEIRNALKALVPDHEPWYENMQVWEAM